MGNRPKRPMRDLGPSARRFRTPGSHARRTSQPGTSKWLLNPSLSPDGDRLVYRRIDRAGSRPSMDLIPLWWSAYPAYQCDTRPSGECGGSWSPDGSRFVYLQTQAGNTSLMIVKTSGNTAPVSAEGSGPLVHRSRLVANRKLDHLPR